MSIFQIKELWSTNVGNSEEFDRNSICIGNIDNSDASQTKIAVGNQLYILILLASFEGILRIYLPQTKSFTINDLLLEKNLGLPIL